MPIFKHAYALASLAVLVPTLALAQTNDQDASDWEEEYPALQDDDGGPPPAAAQAPDESPPPPPAADSAPDRGVPEGQWVRTSQYGWVWMPYADTYTYVPPNGYGEPYMYVWGPSLGWSWVAAPWVWGFGPWPYFGAYAPFHFGWYGHGWWRTPSRWHWVHRPFHGYGGGGWGHGWGHGGYHGVAPAPYRGVPRPAPGFRGGERPFPGGHGFGGRGFFGAPGGARSFSGGHGFGGRHR